MAQRGAMARALVTRPPVLLLDEPFSALDALTAPALQEELLRLWAQDRPTMLLVTHDLDEALYLADRVVVLGGHPGRVRLDLDGDRCPTAAARRRGARRACGSGCSPSCRTGARAARRLRPPVVVKERKRDERRTAARAAGAAQGPATRTTPRRR